MTLHITAQELMKTYGDTHAVDRVSFDIREGERVGVIGRNGAGKTTLLQMIAGIAAISGGELKIAGHVTAIFTIGIGLRDDLTGRENIRIDSEMQGHTAAETKAFMPAVIDFAELGDFIDRPVRTYSTGMKARLAFSMLVHIDPEILIIDEALSVGDANFSRKATAKMRELAARGRILILVSHSMASICDMCTRCIWMDNGRIRMDGAPEEVTCAYLDAVREADDKLLMQRFQSELVHVSHREGWAIDEMQFSDSAGGMPLSVLQTGEKAFLRLGIAAPAGARCDATLTLSRLDGVHISDSHAGPFTADSTGRILLQLDFGALPLNYGFYSARCSLSVDGEEAVRRSICFEVVNRAPHKGGRPTLVVPFTSHSEKIA